MPERDEEDEPIVFAEVYALRFQIGQRHQNGQAGHAIEEDLPEPGIGIDHHQLAKGRHPDIQRIDLPAGKPKTEGQRAQAQPGQEISSRGWCDGVQPDDKTGRDDDDKFWKQGQKVSAIQIHRAVPWAFSCSPPFASSGAVSPAEGWAVGATFARDMEAIV